MTDWMPRGSIEEIGAKIDRRSIGLMIDGMPRA
jgi:hypothetical protein